MNQVAAMEVGIAVVDLDRMLRFYTGVLGCEEVRRSEIPGALSSRLGLAAKGYLCVWLKTPYGEVIKLMSPPEPPAVLEAPEHLTSRTGVAYLTFYVSDIAAVLARAEAQGASLRSDRELVSDAAGLGVKLGFFRDPEGNIVELVETAR